MERDARNRIELANRILMLTSTLRRKGGMTLPRLKELIRAIDAFLVFVETRR